MKKLLIIDDDIAITKSILYLMKKEMPEVEAIAENSPKNGIQQAIKNEFELILMDFMMPKINGVDAAKQILVKKPNQKILLFSSVSGAPNIGDFLHGFVGVLDKPESVDTMLKKIRFFLGK